MSYANEVLVEKRVMVTDARDSGGAFAICPEQESLLDEPGALYIYKA